MVILFLRFSPALASFYDAITLTDFYVGTGPSWAGSRRLPPHLQRLWRAQQRTAMAELSEPRGGGLEKQLLAARLNGTIFDAASVQYPDKLVVMHKVRIDSFVTYHNEREKLLLAFELIVPPGG